MAHKYDISGENNKIVLFDDNGHEYPLKKNIPGLNIRVSGNNNTVRIHKKTIFENSEIVINNDMAEIEIKESSLLRILVGMGYGHGQKLHIGRGTRIGGAYFTLPENGAIFIGDDCLFSDGILLMAADGHMLFNKDTHEIINMPTPIVIGNHCWLGHACQITKGASLADNSVLGLGAILTRRITTPHVAVAGVPARIVRENIDWSGMQILTFLGNQTGQPQTETVIPKWPHVKYAFYRFMYHISNGKMRSKYKHKKSKIKSVLKLKK